MIQSMKLELAIKIMKYEVKCALNVNHKNKIICFHADYSTSLHS